MRVRAACAMLAVALSACTTHASDSARSSKQRTLRLAVSGQFSSLDPIYLNGYSAAAVGALAFSYLLRVRPDGSLAPDIATAVPTLANGGISADGRTIVYHLRHHVVWQDGAPLTSADVAFTERAVMNPKNTIGVRIPYDRVAAIETPDAYTVRVRLRTPDASMAALFFTPDGTAGILPEHLLGHDASLDHVAFNQAPIGSGPYRVARWDHGLTVRFVANPTYYGGKPKLAAIELRYVPDTTTSFVQLQTGELDGIVRGDVAYDARYAALGNENVTRVPEPATSTLIFNTERPVLTVAVRRALAELVDASSLVRELYHGAMTAHDAARGYFSYADDPTVRWPAYDPAAAERALDDAEWKRDSAGVRASNGRELELTMVYPINSLGTRLTATSLQQAFARAGVRVELQGVGYDRLSAPAADGGPLESGHFDLALGNILSGVDPDVSWWLSCGQRAPVAYNLSRYCNRRMDGLLRAALRSPDRGRRIAVVREVERLAAADLPFLPLWQVSGIDVLPKRLTGFVANGDAPFSSASRWAWSP